jgi:uncharacterized phage protein (TIGR01671 family)
MNRQISFRVWDDEKKEMVYDVAVLSEYAKMPKYTGNEIYIHPKSTIYSLMQFTGLLDKHNKMIYEGDVISIYIPTQYDELKSGRFGRRLIAQVKFSGGAFWFDGDGQTDCNWHFYNASDREIIGNVFENPEPSDSPRSI